MRLWIPEVRRGDLAGERIVRFVGDGPEPVYVECICCQEAKPEDRPAQEVEIPDVAKWDFSIGHRLYAIPVGVLFSVRAG